MGKAIRLPDFVTKDDFDWAVKEAAVKKKTDFSKVEFLIYEEGECVQCLHIGPYAEGITKSICLAPEDVLRKN